MAEHHLDGDPPLAVTLRRSARARRISLRVSGLDGRITLTLPRGVPDAEGLAFAAEKSSWLRKQVAAKPDRETPGFGALLPVAGQDREIVPGAGRSVRLLADRIEVPGAADRVAARLAGFLKADARTRLAAAADLYAGRLGRGYARLSLRDTRSRWGSCTADGGLMFSWRLAMAPPAVLDYVAAHEVAHLQEMNHSRAFWDVVGNLYGDPAAERRWLRENGPHLHRFRF